MKPFLFVCVSAALTAAWLSACNQDPPPAQTSASQVQQGQQQASGAAAEARDIYARRCAVCHGAEGRGDGPAAKNLKPRPRDHSNPEWQATVTNDFLKKVIVEGGAAAGLSFLMPANPDLGRKPEVLNEVVRLIRSFAEQEN